MKRSIVLTTDTIKQELEIKEFIHVKVKYPNDIYLDKVNDGYKLSTTGKFDSTANINKISITILNPKQRTGILTIHYRNNTEESHQVKLVCTNKDTIGVWITQQRAMYTVLINDSVDIKGINKLELTFNRED